LFLARQHLVVHSDGDHGVKPLSRQARYSQRPRDASPRSPCMASPRNPFMSRASRFARHLTPPHIGTYSSRLPLREAACMAEESRLLIQKLRGITRIEFLERNILDEAAIQQIGEEITAIVAEAAVPKIL